MTAATLGRASPRDTPWCAEEPGVGRGAARQGRAAPQGAGGSGAQGLGAREGSAENPPSAAWGPAQHHPPPHCGCHLHSAVTAESRSVRTAWCHLRAEQPVFVFVKRISAAGSEGREDRKEPGLGARRLLGRSPVRPNAPRCPAVSHRFLYCPNERTRAPLPPLSTHRNPSPPSAPRLSGVARRLAPPSPLAPLCHLWLFRLRPCCSLRPRPCWDRAPGALTLCGFPSAAQGSGVGQAFLEGSG